MIWSNISSTEDHVSPHYQTLGGDDGTYIWNNPYLNCGVRWKGRMIIAVNFRNLSNWKEETWKKSGLQRDSNPFPPQYRCDAPPTELWSHTLGARSIYRKYDVRRVLLTNFEVFRQTLSWVFEIFFSIDPKTKEKTEKWNRKKSILIKVRFLNVTVVILCLNLLNYSKNIWELYFIKLTKMSYDNELKIP